MKFCKIIVLVLCALLLFLETLPSFGLYKRPFSQTEAISQLFTSQCPLRKAFGDNSRTSLDWAGEYKGITPCADCPGIDLTITLNQDGSFKRTISYQERSVEPLIEQGSFEWDENGNNLTLTYGAEKSKFKVGENRLFMLDLDGNRIEGDMADYYILNKTSTANLTETYWKLTKLFDGEIGKFSNEPHFILKAEGNRVTGSSGCNRMMGSYVLGDSNALTFGQMAGTRMACMDGMEIENRVYNVLEQTSRYELNGNTLTLFNAENPLAVFQAVYL